MILGGFATPQVLAERTARPTGIDDSTFPSAAAEITHGRLRVGDDTLPR